MGWYKFISQRLLPAITAGSIMLSCVMSPMVLNAAEPAEQFGVPQCYESEEKFGVSSIPSKNSSPRQPNRRPFKFSALSDAGIEVDSAVRHWSISEQYYADYDELNFVGALGSKWNLSIKHNKLVVDIPSSAAADVYVYYYDTQDLIAEESSAGQSIEVDCLDEMNCDSEYWVDVVISIDNEESEFYDIYLTKSDKGNLVFLKSPVYDYNQQSLEKLWTDEKSLADCLEEQHDIMWNSPEVLEFTQELTSGAINDYDRVLTIYRYIIDNYYYDYDQVNAVGTIFQDDFMLLFADKVAVCEGLAHVFVGICRSIGIPATVSFGYAEDLTDLYYVEDVYSNHAWAEVFIDGQWYFCDFTWDMMNEFSNGVYSENPSTLNWFLVPIEVVSFTHKILNADTRHAVERSDSCGDNSQFTVTRDGVLTFSGTGTVKLPVGVDDFNQVVFEEGSNITSIGSECFKDCDLIKKIVLPGTLRSIGNEAFFTCEDLEYIYIPSGVTEIGKSAFNGCDELAFVFIPESVSEIKRHAFDNCPRLVLSLPFIFGQLDVHEYNVTPLSVKVRNK